MEIVLIVETHEAERCLKETNVSWLTERVSATQVTVWKRRSSKKVVKRVQNRRE